MRVDALDGHRRFVDEHADGQRETAQRHDVDRLTRHPEAHDGGQQGEWNRSDHNQGTAEIPQKHEDHQSGQHRSQETFRDQALQGIDDIPGLVEHQVDLDVLGRHVAHRRQRLPDVPNHIQRRRVRTLGDGNVDGAFPVHVRVADDDVGGVGDRADISQIDRGTGADTQWRIEELLDVPAERRVGRRDPNQVSGSHVSRGQHGTGPVDREDDLVRRDPIRPELFRVDAHHDRPLAAAKRRRRRDAGQRGKNRTHAVEGDVLHFARRACRAREDQLRDGHAARVEPHDEGRHGTGRHERTRTVHIADNFRHRLAHIRVRMEVQLHQGDALDVLGFDVFNAGDVQKVVLVVVRQVPFHLGGIHASVRLCDIDRGRAQLRKDIDLHLPDRHDRRQRDGNDGHNDRDRTSDSGQD